MGKSVPISLLFYLLLVLIGNSKKIFSKEIAKILGIETIMLLQKSKKKTFIFSFLLLGLMIAQQSYTAEARDETIANHFFSDTVIGGEGWVRYFLPDNNTYAINSNVTISNFTMTVGTNIYDYNVRLMINHSANCLFSVNNFEFNMLFDITEYEQDNITYYPAWNSYLFILSDEDLDSIKISVPIGGRIRSGDNWVKSIGLDEWMFLNTTEENGYLCTYLNSSGVINTLSIFSQENGTATDPLDNDGGDPSTSGSNFQAIIVTTSIASIIIIPILILSLVVMSKAKYREYVRKKISELSPSGHRLSIDEVLENENRSNIIDLVLEEPGVHFNELLRKTGLAPGNLVWHLDILTSYKVIGSKRVGQYLVYFPFYTSNPMSNLDIKLAKSKTTLSILNFIEDEPGTYASEIARRLNFDHKTVKYHVDKLLDNNLVYVKKKGRKKLIYPKLQFGNIIDNNEE